MRSRLLLVGMARAVSAAYFLGSAAYCVLCYSSFAYYQFIRPELIGWLPGVLAMHHQLFWLAFLPALLTLLPDLRARRVAAWAFVVVGTALGSWLLARPVMLTVGYSPRSLVVAMLSLLPLVWLAALDHVGRVPRWAPGESDRRAFSACARAAVGVWLAYAVAIPWRLSQVSGVELRFAPMAVALASSLGAHALVFAIGYLLLVVAFAVGSLARRPWVEYLAHVVLAMVATTLALQKVVCQAISFNGWAGWIVAAAFGFTLALVWSAFAWRCAVSRGTPHSALDVWLSPFSLLGGRRASVGAVVLFPVAAYLAAAAVAQFDWNFLLQKLSVLGMWGMALGLAYALGRTREPGAARPGPLVAIAPAAVTLLLAVPAPYIGRQAGTLATGSVLQADFIHDRYAAVDPSFSLIRELLRANSGEAAAFYSYLKAHSAIGRVDVQPIDVSFAPLKAAHPGPRRRPHIFLFVIDSLRRDYLSPYNDAVTFTPAIQRFANESFVFDRAFTRYGGTGLAVPSIWAGGMLMHKQYVRPFDPMDTLLKLLRAHDYRRVMSYDSIVSALVPRGEQADELDRGRRNEDFDLCSTLDQLSGRLQETAGDGRPVFAYSLPQTVHFAVVMFQKPKPAPDAYPGFFAPVATAMHRTDGCFGRFVNDLKRSGLYDDSIVILTSDHGDSLGEEGRWGHAYTIFPEVMRVPLIVHLPRWIASEVTTDLGRLAFTSDVTPSLYALLGDTPASLGPLYGEPLFVPRGQSLSDRRQAAYLVASSYGAVYGILRHNGRSMYIADAISGRDYAFDLGDGRVSRPLGVTDALREANWTLIRDQIGALAAQYHYTPTP